MGGGDLLSPHNGRGLGKILQNTVGLRPESAESTSYEMNNKLSLHPECAYMIVDYYIHEPRSHGDLLVI